jgi:8-oxo-dGTP pyrophosphatase MutT (NUDIX family)
MKIAYGCGIIVKNEFGEILFGTRIDGQGICVAGGKIEPGEFPSQAATRELEEEFGLSGSLSRLGKIVSSAFVRGEKCITISTIFEAHATVIIQKPTEELSNLQWLSIEKALEHPNLFEPTRQALLSLYTDTWGG